MGGRSRSGDCSRRLPVGLRVGRSPTMAQPQYLPQPLVAWFQCRLLAWAHSNFRQFPWRETTNPFHILIAEVLLQQTFARKVVPVYSELVFRYPTPQMLAVASVADLRALLLPLGFTRRAERLVELARVLLERHGGHVPADIADLLALPGVGPYTAGAVLAIAFDVRASIPDANVIRVLSRFFGLPVSHRGYANTSSRLLRSAALEVVPAVDPRKFSLALLDHAALTCTHYRPKCNQCPLSARCSSVSRGASGK